MLLVLLVLLPQQFPLTKGCAMGGEGVGVAVASIK